MAAESAEQGVAGAPFTAAEWIVVVGSVALLLLYGIQTGPAAARAAVRALRSTQTALRPRPGSPDRASERQARKMTNDRRRKKMERYLFFSSTSLAALCAIFCVRTVAGSPRALALHQSMVVFATFASALSVRRWISRYPRTLVQFAYCFDVTAAMLVVALTDDALTLIYFQCVLVPPRILLSWAYMRTGVVSCFTILHGALSCFAYSRTGGLVAFGLDVFIRSECWISALLILMTWIMENTNSTQVHQELEAAAMQNEVSASKKLLNTFCDATFELDQEHCIVNDAQQLAGVLQRGCRRSLKGTKMDQLMTEQDHELFKELTTAHVPENHSMATVFHIRMRDDLDNLLDMEVFHVPLAGSLAGSCHLIGVREHSDSKEFVGPVPSNMSSQSAVSQLGDSFCGAWAPAAAQPQGPLVVKFDASSFEILHSSGQGAETFQVGESFKKFLHPQQDFFTDLHMGLAAVKDRLSSDPSASFEFRSIVAVHCKGAAWLESLCSVSLSGGATQDSVPTEKIVATFQAIHSRMRHT